MIKKTFLIFSLSLVFSGCAVEESDTLAPIKQDTEESVKTASKVNEDEGFEEQVIQVDLTPLQGKVWSNPEEESYLYFEGIHKSKIEFLYLSPEGYRMQEQSFTAEIAKTTANSVEGTIANSSADLGKSQFKLTRKNDQYEVSIENFLSFKITETPMNLDDWAVVKNTVKELTESEALNLIYQAEKSATKSFGDAFTESAEGFSFNQPFENIASTVKDYYTKDYPLHEIYEDPAMMYEPLYAFPLTEVPKENFYVDKSAEKIKIYHEADMYGNRALHLYTLIIEDGLWKIDSRDFLLSPLEAAYAAKALSDSSDDPEILARSMESNNFHDYIETLLEGSRYHIELYDEYDGGHQTYGLYQVDPVTRMVYYYDRVLDEATEIGPAF